METITVYGPSGIFSVLSHVAKKYRLTEDCEIIDPLIEKKIINENMSTLRQSIETALEIEEIIKTNT